MGVKYDGGDIFDAAMNGLTSCPGVTPEMIRRTAEPLIKELLAFHWDNAEGTLGEYTDNPEIVAAFRANGILVKCDGEHPVNPWQCEEEQGHYPGTLHKDYQRNTWSEEENVT